MPDLTGAHNPAGFWIELDSITFAEGDNVTWIHAFPLGEYEHPIHGKINSTPERVANMANNVKMNIRGQELDIDYDHKERDGKAAGWVKDAEARSDGLWLAVQWTEPARQAIANKEYRYFSPEYADMWKHPKTGEQYKDVVFGGALTNRPFLKDILPINMSEVVAQRQGEAMPEIAKLLGLAEDATEDQIVTKLSAVLSEQTEEPEEEEENEEETEEEEEESAELSEDDIVALAESSPAVKSLLEKVSRLETANHLSEIDNRLAKMNTGKKRVLSPAAVKKLREAVATAPKKLADGILDSVDEILEKGIVELEERGGSVPDGSTEIPKKFTDKVDSIVKNDQLSYADAVERVALTEPDLYEAYRRETANN